MALTRGDVKRIVSQRLKEFQGTPAGDDPFLYNDHIQRVVTEIAKRTFCLYMTRTTSLVANQYDYCVADLFRFKGAYMTDAAGNTFPLKPLQEWDADSKLGWGWQNATATDPPTHLLYTALEGPSYRLWPTPSTARTAAFGVKGFWAPTDSWSFDIDGNPEAITDSSNVPFNASFEELVLNGVAAKRGMDFLTKENAEQVREIKNDYEMGVRRLEGLARTAWRSSKRETYGG